MVRSSLLALFGLVAVLMLTFTATAHAAGAVVPADGSFMDYLGPVIQAFRDGSYLYAGSIALVAAVAVFRRYAPRYLPSAAEWSATDAGGAILTLIGAFGASMAAALASDHDAFSWTLAWHACQIAAGAAGGYAILKAVVIKPYLLKLADKGPAWLHYPMQAVLWIFQETGKTPTASEQAVAAIHAIDKPNIDVTVAVTTSEGTAIANSPATAPAPSITVVSNDVAIPRTSTK